jgi:hypothetical protein
MNTYVDCVLDGEYWNIVGDSRGRHGRAKQKIFTYEADHIPVIQRPVGPSKPLTPEQKEKAKQRSDEQRKAHLRKVNKEHRKYDCLRSFVVWLFVYIFVLWLFVSCYFVIVIHIQECEEAEEDGGRHSHLRVLARWQLEGRQEHRTPQYVLQFCILLMLIYLMSRYLVLFY